MAWIDKLFRVPIEIDEDEQFVATLLHYVLVVTIVMTIIYAVLATVLNFSPELFWINYVALAGQIILYILLRNHYVRPTAWIFFFLFLLLIAFVGIEDGGLTDPHHASSSILIIALAAFILRRRGVIAFTFLACCISFAFLLMSESVFDRPLASSLPNFVLNIIIYVIVGLITGYAIDRFDKVISRLRENELTLTQLNKVAREQNEELSSVKLRLETTNNLLEDRVVERTKELESVNEKLAQARDQAIEALAIKNRILANLSHDVRTPLNVILLRAGLLERHGPLTEKHQKGIENITAQTLQLLDLFENLLSEAQLQSSIVQPNYQLLALTELMDESLSGIKSLARQKDLKIKTYIDENLPDEILGSTLRLNQIITNLAGNSVKFTQEGQITVKFLRVDNEYWKICVSDTGEGIPEKHQQGIFEAFWQVDGTTTRTVNRGVGLGLSIVKQLTELMNGEITLESVFGQGSTFTVILPLLLTKESIADDE